MIKWTDKYVRRWNGQRDRMDMTEWTGGFYMTEWTEREISHDSVDRQRFYMTEWTETEREFT